MTHVEVSADFRRVSGCIGPTSAELIVIRKMAEPIPPKQLSAELGVSEMVIPDLPQPSLSRLCTWMAPWGCLISERVPAALLAMWWCDFVQESWRAVYGAQQGDQGSRS